MAPVNRSKKSPDLRVIKTARDESSINKAVRNGFKPLIKKVVPFDEIRSKYSVIQSKKTGEIEILGDYRVGNIHDENSEYKTVIDWTFYYPYCFKSPFAACLIPDDIVIGERVFIKDLIQYYVGSSWNQGDTYRLESCEAIWNGTDLEIQYDSSTNRLDFVG